MPQIALRRETVVGVVADFLKWDNDPRSREAFARLVDETDGSEGTMALLTFWAGVWYAKTHPEEVIVEDGDARADRELAPRFV